MKRQSKHILTVICISVLLSGCYLKSVHPLISLDEAIPVPGLEGRWESEDQRWTFIHDFENIPGLNLGMSNDDKPENAYLIIFENLENPEEDTTYFAGSIGRFSGHYFLDLYVIDLDGSSDRVFDLDVDPDTFKDIHYFPVHTFSRIALGPGQLSIEFFKDEWIKSLIEDNRVRIKHEKVDDNILITASTKELQKFVTKYADDNEAYDDPLQLNGK